MSLSQMEEELHTSFKLQRELVSFVVQETGDIKIIYLYDELPSRVKQVVLTLTPKKKQFQLIHTDQADLLDKLVAANKGKPVVFSSDYSDVSEILTTIETTIADLQAIADGKDPSEYAHQRETAKDKLAETNVLMSLCVEFGIDLDTAREVESIIRRHPGLTKQQVEANLRDVLHVFSKR